MKKYSGKVITFFLLIFKNVIASVLRNQRLIQNSFPEEQNRLKPQCVIVLTGGGGRNGTEDGKKSSFVVS